MKSSGFGESVTDPPFPSGRDFASFALLAVAIAVVFGQTLGFQFVPYDDPAYVTGNGYVNGGLTPRGILWAFTYWNTGALLAHPGAENLWHPLTWISHMADVQVFGVRNPGGHHFTSVLLHILTAWTVCLFAARLTASRLAGLVAALLFAIHPLRVESVAWVSERKDVLSGLFFFGSLLLILLGHGRAAFFTFLAAMMAKPSTVVLPVVAILAQGWIAGETIWGLKFWRTRVVEWRWWFVAAVAVALLAVGFQGKGSHAPLMENLPLWFRLLHLADGLWLTLWHAIFPVGLTFHYSYPPTPLWMAAGAWALLLGAGATVWLLRARYRGIFFASAWFFVCTLPSSGILYVGTSLTADRYTYLSLTGAFVMFGLWVAERGAVPKLRFALAGVIVVLLVLLSRLQCATWRDGLTLFTHAESVQPHNPVVLGNLGGVHQQAGRHEEAMALFRRTLAIAPRDNRAWYNLGNSLRDTGRPAEAGEAFRQAVEIAPDFSNAWRNLGLILCAQINPDRRPGEARDAFARAVELTGRRDPVPILLQAEMEFELGNIPETKSLLAELKALNPADPKVDRAMNDLRRRLPY